MIPGCNPLLTTRAPMIAFPITSSSPSQLSKIIHPRCRLAVKEKSASSSDESPRGSEVSRLPNSIQVCTGSKLSSTVSRVIVSGSIPFLTACRLNFSISNLSTSIWSTWVGESGSPSTLASPGNPSRSPLHVPWRQRQPG